ncbi:MAG: hydrogenase, partial [Verrucomicrobia bacterium]|nr:hydrogenase [Verrucomicrobiota bacterium]
MSKTVPPPCPEPATGPLYWRSLEHLAETPEFRAWAEREFPAGASELRDPHSRRDFMKLMSASFLLAGAGLTGCRRPVETIQPFAKQPEGYTHGLPQHYATAMPRRGGAVPLVVTTHEGRPIKIEGNAEHPLNAALARDPADRHGGTDLPAQASLLNLYDPDRARRYTFKGLNSTREQALDALAEAARKFADRQGKGLCFLLERSGSPSRARLQQLLTEKLPQARWFTYEPVDFDPPRRGASLAFGRAVRPLYHLERARRVLALDCDFLGVEEEAYRLIRGFARGRAPKTPGDELNRLYVAESLLTVTGSNADHRLRLAASQVFPLAAWLGAEVLEAGGAPAPGTPAAAAVAALREAASGLTPEVRRWGSVCAQDLWASRGQVAVLAGHRQPLAVHWLAQVLNFQLGRAGGAVGFIEASEPASGTMAALVQALHGSEVDTLVVLGGNPVYNAPADLEWAKAQRQATTIFRLGAYEDETAPHCDWHLPMAHYLESWGDARTADGSLVPVQPLIEPLFGGLTELEVLARVGGLEAVKPHDIVRGTFQGLAPEGVFEENWKKYLHAGYLPGSAAKAVEVELQWGTASQALAGMGAKPPPSATALEVVFAPDNRVDDGRYTNNGWLQELPDPITKIVWDNVVYLSEKTARELGVAVVDENRMNLRVPVVRLESAGRTIEGPAWIQPGLADYVVGVTLGYGRPAA